MPQATALPNTLGAAIQRCRALMGDKTGYLVTRPYAVEMISQAYSDMAKAIKNASGKNFEAIIEVLNIPTGTTDLSLYQRYSAPPNNKRGPLVGLTDPIRLWVKTAGQLPQFYTSAKGPRDTLPHINPPGITAGTFQVTITFAWIGNKLLVTPVAGPIDVQVYGRFDPPDLQADEDQLLLYPNMTDTLSYAACAIMGVERANPNILQGYAARAEAGVDNIVADIIRQSQKNPRRFAQMGGAGGCGGTYYGWGSY